MKTATLRRWLWLAFLAWTAFALVVLPFDVGPAEISHWIAVPALRAALVALLQVTEAVWLVLAAANLYFYIVDREDLAVARRAAIVLLAGTGLALGVGVATGLPFGPFIFTGRLGAKLFGVPFSAPLLWFVIIAAARYTVLHFWEHAQRWQIALASGMLVVGTDLSLEWVAWRIRGLWLWWFPLANTPNWPPPQNFLTWFLLAPLLVWLAFPPTRAAGRHPRPALILLALNVLLWLTLVARHFR